MAKKRVGKFPNAFRQMAVDRLNRCENIVTLAKELVISRHLLYTWREKVEPLEHGLRVRRWVADITYIRLRVQFVYLAVLLDGFSRRVVGWALDTTLATRLPLRELPENTQARENLRQHLSVS